jgi:hypothetical protein
MPIYDLGIPNIQSLSVNQVSYAPAAQCAWIKVYMCMQEPEYIPHSHTYITHLNSVAAEQMP